MKGFCVIESLAGGDLIIPDIIAVYNTSGTKLVSYVYDAWGNVTVTNHNVSGTNSGARHNPFRYRGYYYDTETGYYYLQSRYYNPEWGRFISPDSFDIIGSTTDDLYDNNLYSYCDNNPVMRVDDGGEFWHILAGAAVGSIINGTMKIISNAIEGKSLTSGLGIAMLSGAASGALGSMGIGIGVIIAGNAAISMSENAINQIIDNNGFDNFNVGDMLFDGMVGGISGGIGGAGTGSKYLTNLGYQTVKRTFKSTFHSGIKTGLKEAGKAFNYYGKSTTKYYNKFIRSLRDNVITSAVTSTVTSSYTKSQYRRFIDYLERNT